MKKGRSYLPNLAYIAAFIIGVIFFASLWKSIGGTASSSAVIAGMAGVAVTVFGFRIWNELKNREHKED
jgi:hypothetical protein